MLQLYNYFRSSASFRVRIALNLKGLEYKEIPVHLLNNGGEHLAVDYQAINPQGLVPTLQDNSKTITQSLAIIEYLDELHPEPPLMPKDPYQKALVRAFALAIAADMHPLNNLRVLKFLNKDLNLSEEQKVQWYQHWIATGFSALEKSLTSSPHTTDFCFGQTPTIADICLVPQMYNARRFNCDISAYPTLVKIDAHCQTQPAFIKAQPQETS
ncbi:MAG: maleylacetoacetate isomerase [Gammaproteobacteria bacterium]